MSTLILCGLMEEETRDFIDAERALLDGTIAQKGMRDGKIQTLRLRELPDPADEEKVRGLGQKLLGAFGLETQEFKTEFLNQNGFKFLAIYSDKDKVVTPEIAPVQKNQPDPQVLRKRWRVRLITAGVIGLVALLYYGIGFILTRQVSARYTGRECDGVVGLAGSVEKAYPLKIVPFTAPALKQATECKAYLNAESLYKQRSWEKAYQAYWEYSKAYPNGIYSKESKNLAAESLFAWASEQRGKQDFSNAVDNLKLLLNNYGDTAFKQKAKEALPEVYLEWGGKSRADGNFAEAEAVYLSMSDWSQIEREQANITRAQVELTQTYFSWGKDLQSRNDFKSAAAKFDKAVSIDPNAKDANSPSAQIRTSLPGFHRAWGEYLIKGGSYSEAIEHFKTSITLASPKEIESAKSALIQAYLEWAASLSKKEDYNQALGKIELAKGSAATDDGLGKVDTALQATLDQFSKSKGAQAKKIITDTVNSICANGKPIEVPPVVRILSEKRLAVSGVDLDLSTNVLAQAPGNLYFVACAEENEVTVQSCPYSRFGFGSASYWIKRVQYNWKFKVFNSQTGKLYKQKAFSGSSPESCPYTHRFSVGSTTHFHYGGKPSASTVENWLASLLK